MISDIHLTQMIGEAKKSQKQRKFKQSVELIMVFRDIDVKKGFAINETVQLPKTLSQPASVCVVASGKSSYEHLVVFRERRQGKECAKTVRQQA